MSIRAFCEVFKLYKMLVCILGKNLLWEDLNLNSGGETDQGDLKIYSYALVGLEALSFIVMCLAMHYVRKTIEVFGRNEFDLIRENFTHDFYTKVQEPSRDDWLISVKSKGIDQTSIGFQVNLNP